MLYILFTILLGTMIFLASIYYYYIIFLKKKKLLYDIDESKKVKVTKDIIYKNVDNKNLLMDIYTPENLDSKDKLPVVIFVHGEGPELFIGDAKDWGVFSGYGKLLSSKGFAAVTFNHRYAGSNYENIKEVSKDVTDAVDYIRNNAEKYNIDSEKICVWSFSLGGLYSSLFLKEEGIKCLISYYGLLDIYTRVSKDNDIYKEFTPKKYLKESKNNTSILIVKGAKDRIKAVNKSIDNFIHAAEGYGVNYKYIVHNTGGHAFDVLKDNKETRKVIGQTLQFIEKSFN